MNKLANFLYLGRNLALFILAVTSFIVVTTGAYAQGMAWTGIPFISGLGAVAAGIAFYAAVDAALAVIVDEFFRVWVGDFKSLPRDQKFFYGILGVFMSILLLVTSSTSIFSAFIVADVIVETPEVGSVARSLDESDRSTNYRLELLKGELDEARRSESARVERAKMAGATRIDDALGALGPNIRQLYLGENNWVRTSTRFKTYREGIAAAKRDSAALVEQEISVAANLAQDFSAAASEADRLNASKVTQLTDSYNAELDRADTKRTGWSIFLVLVQITCAVAGMFFAYLFAKSEFLFGKAITPGRYSLVGALNQLTTVIWQYPLARLSRWIEIPAEDPQPVTTQGFDVEDLQADFVFDTAAEEPDDDVSDIDGMIDDARSGSLIDKGRVAAMLLDQGLTYQEIADRMGSSKSTVHGWKKAFDTFNNQ